MRFSRLYEQTAEFRARCKAFDFAIVAHAVLDIVVAGKKELIRWWKQNWHPIHYGPTFKLPHQLALELDGIAQMPLFRKGV